MSRPDPELVIRLQGNDLTAFDALYNKYHQAVYRNILKVTKDASAAEDLLQEVFVRLWERKGQLDPVQSVGGWLFVISFNLSVNHTRKKLREEVMYKQLLVGRSAEDSYSDMPVIVEEQFQLLEQAIEQLSPQRRKVLSLCKLQGKTYEEAASELQISRHTVKEHMSAAMVSLNDYVRKNASHACLPFLLLWLDNSK